MILEKNGAWNITIVMEQRIMGLLGGHNEWEISYSGRLFNVTLNPVKLYIITVF
jgi:hypothetical protein